MSGGSSGGSRRGSSGSSRGGSWPLLLQECHQEDREAAAEHVTNVVRCAVEELLQSTPAPLAGGIAAAVQMQLQALRRTVERSWSSSSHSDLAHRLQTVAASISTLTLTHLSQV
jgi:hypothetical protein